MEESAKAAALLLLFVFRRRRFTGPADGFVIAGFTATGFAFTENVLYLGNAFEEDLAKGTGVLDSVTAATFFVRAVLSPFAHPLFTVLTGLGFGAAAARSVPAVRAPSGRPCWAWPSPWVCTRCGTAPHTSVSTVSTRSTAA